MVDKESEPQEKEFRDGKHLESQREGEKEEE